MSLTITARVEAAAGAGDRLIGPVKTLVAAVREEPGCLQYDLHRSTENSDLFMFVEAWESHALWQAHMQGAAVKAFNAEIGEGAIVSAEVLQLQQVA